SKPLAGEIHLLGGPVGAGAIEPILPFDVVPAMDADIEALVANAAHHMACPPAYVGAGQQSAVKQRFDAVVLDHRRPLHLAEEARTKHAFDRAPGVIGSEAE